MDGRRVECLVFDVEIGGAAAGSWELGNRFVRPPLFWGLSQLYLYYTANNPNIVSGKASFSQFR